jgi:hypothetical protein
LRIKILGEFSKERNESTDELDLSLRFRLAVSYLDSRGIITECEKSTEFFEWLRIIKFGFCGDKPGRFFSVQKPSFAAGSGSSSHSIVNLS